MADQDPTAQPEAGKLTATPPTGEKPKEGETTPQAKKTEQKEEEKKPE